MASKSHRVIRDPDIDVWHICQLYISDNSNYLTATQKEKLSGWIRSRCWKKLAACASLCSSGTMDEYRALTQVAAFFKKNASFSVKDVTIAEAVSRFREAESKCAVTNDRLDSHCDQLHLLDADLFLWLEKMKRVIRDTLGSFEEFLLNVPKVVKVTNGASARLSRSRSHRSSKWSRKASSTSAGMPYVKALSRYVGVPVHQERFVVCDQNRIVFVPKSAVTDRPIACEPEGSLIFQLAFDTYVKGRLRCKHGCDLGDQTRNQRAAFRGSVDGSHATVDLEMASDTLAFNTVALLLPFKWFKYLKDQRSQYGYGKQLGSVKYAKFSSMGNGATFALETLVFVAACLAVGARDFEVYGDDIVIETHLVADLQVLLEYLGFSFNHKKSFTQGPVRESCGMTYYEGRDITPFYLRTNNGLKPNVALLVNSMMLRSEIEGNLLPYLANLTVKRSVQLVPQTSDLCAGVWINFHTSTKLKLFTHRHWITLFRGYSARRKRQLANPLGGYGLWLLDRYQKPIEVMNALHMKCVAEEWSTKDAGTSKYRLQYRSWFPSDLAETEFIQLDIVSELLFSLIQAKKKQRRNP